MKPDNQKYYDLLARGFVAIGAILTLMYVIYYIVDLLKDLSNGS